VGRAEAAGAVSEDLAARLARARQRLVTEREWYADHGGSLAGYIVMYAD
jgi:hypothetical protein